MLSKGINVVTWIAQRGWRVEYTVPTEKKVHTDLHCWSSDIIRLKWIHIAGWTGEFQFVVYDSEGQEVFKKTNSINVFYGTTKDGGLAHAHLMKSLVRDDVVITFGFFDSGLGSINLPNMDACWVTVTPNWSNWMGELAVPGSRQAAKPLTTLVLPSPHDVGMNSMRHCLEMLSATDNKRPICQALGVSNYFSLADIIAGFAITQKDTVPDMLRTGARYFEFRPAHATMLSFWSRISPRKLYFQHKVVPGIAFDDFLNSVRDFLLEHTNEIVVIQIRFDEVHSSCVLATDPEVKSYVADALAGHTDQLLMGGFSDLTKSIETIRQEKKRLIVLLNVEQSSTYSNTANATLDGRSIVNSYSGFLERAAADGEGKAIAVWQCQATPTRIPIIATRGIALAKGATSPLLSTKVVCDKVTLPWLLENVKSMPTTTLQAIMNDFFDGATADVAILLSRYRLNRN